MLRPAKSRENFAGKLLLSSALVAVSLGYGLWQRHNGVASVIAAGPAPAVPKTLMPVHGDGVKTAPASAASIASLTPDSDVATGVGSTAKQTRAAPAGPDSSTIAMTTPQTNASAATPAVAGEQNVASPSPPAALSAQQMLQMYLPSDDVSPPLPPVTGTPAPGLAPPMPTGMHLEDGDYVSDKHEFEWGDLKVKISIHAGQIIGVQILQFPDHRSQSLYLSQMAGPILQSELIKTQQAQVDVVSSATDTSYAFQDVVANAITKATRG